jgi:hypothetical protein
MQNLTTYLTNLITEKGHSTDDAVVREGHFGLTWQNLIEFCESVNPQDKQQIITTCTKIDFLNGDVFHFLNYLVDGMIQSMHGDNY